MSRLFENTKREFFKIYDDWTFHYLYGRDTEDANNALIAVLNTILNRQADPIVSIEIMNPGDYSDADTQKKSILDIKAKTNADELIDVEIQNGKLLYFANRSIYYCAKMINSSLDSGEDYGTMKKSIMIAIVNGKMFPDSGLLHTSFHFREDAEHFPLSDKAEIHFIELSKVNPKKPVEEMDPVEQFAAYVKFAGDPSKEHLLQNLIDYGGEAITMTEKVFKTLTDEEKEYWRRESIERRERDELCIKNYYHQKGIKKGTAIGKTKACMRIARKMKAAGMSDEEIISLTDISSEELNKL